MGDATHQFVVLAHRLVIEWLVVLICRATVEAILLVVYGG
jgi:hypothetical protein